MLTAGAARVKVNGQQYVFKWGVLATASVRPLPKAATSSLALPQQCSGSQSLPLAPSGASAGAGKPHLPPYIWNMAKPMNSASSAAHRRAPKR